MDDALNRNHDPKSMMQFAELFPDFEIVVPLARQLSWSQIATGSGNNNSNFIFQLTAEENKDLRSQTVTSNSEHIRRCYLPSVFTKGKRRIDV